MFLYEGMVLVIFRKVKSRFFLIKKYSTTKSLVLGIVVWIILSSRCWWGSYSPGFSSRTTLAVSGRKIFAVACPTSRSKCKSVQQRELTLLFRAGISTVTGRGAEGISIWVIQEGPGGRVEKKWRPLGRLLMLWHLA